jgi:DNA-binding HxlR family transcriptional regulator
MDVVEFLNKKGAVPLLCELDTYGVRYSTLEENLPVSVATFDVRRQQALELDLIKVVGEQRGTAGGHVYALTDEGLQVRDRLDEYDVAHTYQVYRFRKEEYDEKVERALDEFNQEE